MAGPQLPFTETLQNPLSFLGVDTKPAQPTNRLEKEAADLGAREEQFLKSNIDLTRDLGALMIKDAEGKNLLKIKEKELEAEHSRERKRIRDRLGKEFYNSPDMQEFKKFADESADKMMFVPSETTAPLLGVVFATIGATGLLLGGLSKGNAKAALSAMNGMAEGFTKGKEDLYKQERQTFDTNVKAMTQRMGILKAKLDVAREKMKYDAESADMEANAAFAEAGADFLKANKDKFGLQDSITKLETQIKQNDTWARLMETKKSAAIKELESERFKSRENELNRQQQFALQQFLETGRQQRAAESIESRERQAASDRQTRALIAQMGQQRVQPIGMADGQMIMVDGNGNIVAKPVPEGFKGFGRFAEKADPAAKPPPINVQQAVQLRNTLIPELETLLPVLERINRQGDWPKFTGLIGVEPRAAEFVFNKDPEAQKAIRTLARFRSAEFETAGKALTKVENKILAPLYQSGFRDYNALKGAVEDGLEAMSAQKVAYERQYPQLAGQESAARPVQPKPSGPKEGDEAPSKSGKPMVFKNGAWEYKQ